MTNRKWVGVLAFAALFCLMSSAPSPAAIVNPGDELYFSGAPYRDGGLSGGGAFLITDTTSKSSWYSFCLERNEYISFGTTYKVGSVGPNADRGGYRGGNPDPISEQTAYLYSLYATGGLDLTEVAGSKEEQAALQYAFWFLEDELAVGTMRTDLSALTQRYLGIADGATADQFYGVRVVNPVTLAGVPSQSQLVYVPEPGAFLLLGSGLIGLLGYRRTRRQV